MSDDEIRVPWSVPGPTDPVERAWATGIRLEGDHYTRVKPIEWSDEGIQDVDIDEDDRR
jgi:hypothetical protein